MGQMIAKKRIPPAGLKPINGLDGSRVARLIAKKRIPPAGLKQRLIRRALKRICPVIAKKRIPPAGLKPY